MNNVFRIIISVCIIFFTWFEEIYAQASSFPELPGWKFSEETREFSKSDLFSYIDGAADNFISYEFESLTVGEYRKGDEGIKAEIYIHADNDNGFGIYSSERFPDYHFIEIGGQAYTSDDILNMTCGKYYIKLFAESSSDDENQTLITLAHLMAGHLYPGASLPEILKFFPVEGKVINAEQFINQGFLGYEFLSKAYTADYSADGKNFKMFIIKTGSSREAGEMLENFLSYNNQKEKVADGEEIIIHDKYNGNIPVILKGNFITGCLNLEDVKMSSTYLSDLSGKIGSEK
jgi:hypothetical protein